MEKFDVAVVGLGALGSAAAYRLARRGARVVGFEQFELGHARGASHDTSRIIRTSYGAQRYVRLAQSAYRDWADLEAQTGDRLTTITGGLVLLPRSGPYAASDFTTSLDAADAPYELLEPSQVMARWPQFRVPDGVDTVYTADSGIVHAARTVTALQLHARTLGATLRDRTEVLRLTSDASGVVVHTAVGDVRAATVVVAADAWTNTLLEPLGAVIPLEIMQEQVTYFAPADAARFDPASFPVWIWEDDRCFYGFPAYGEPLVKAARDISENRMSPAERSFVPDDGLVAELARFVEGLLPDVGTPARTVTCQYALTPDRELVLGALPQHPRIVVALGAGHAFKFTPTIGRILAELALDGGTDEDIAAFAVPAAAPV